MACRAVVNRVELRAVASSVSTTASNTATLQAVLSSYVNTAARITYQNLQVSELFLDAYSLNRRFADSYSIIDVLYLDVGTSFADSYSIIDAHFIRTSKDKTSDLGLSDEQIITTFYSRSFDEQASLISNTFLLQGKVLGDTQLITDDFSKTVTYFRDLASAFTLDDFLTAGVEDLKKHTEGDKGNIFGFDSVLDYDLSTPLQTVQTLVSTPAVLFSTGFSSNSSVTDTQVKSSGINVALDQFIFAQRSPAEIADSLAYNYMLSSGAVTAPTKYSFLFDMSASEFSNQIFPYISTDKRDAAYYQFNYVDKLLDPDGLNTSANLNYERTTFIADLFAGDYDEDFVGLSDLLETVDVSKRVIDERIDFSDRSFLDGRTPAEYADWTGFTKSVSHGDISANDYVLGLLDVDSISDISSSYNFGQLQFIISQLTEEEYAEYIPLTRVLTGGTGLYGNPQYTTSKNFTRTDFVTGLLGVGPNLIDEIAFDYTTGFSSTGQLISTPSIGVSFPATSSYSVTSNSRSHFDKKPGDILSAVHPFDAPVRTVNELADILSVNERLDAGAISIPTKYRGMWPVGDESIADWSLSIRDGASVSWNDVLSEFVDRLNSSTSATIDYQSTTFIDDLFAGKYDTAGFIDFEDSDEKAVSKPLTETISAIDETSFLADKPFTSSYSFDDVFSHSSSSDKTDSFSFTDTETLSVFKHLHSSYSFVSDVSSVRGQTRDFEGGSESTSVTDLVSKSVPKFFNGDDFSVSDGNTIGFERDQYDVATLTDTQTRDVSLTVDPGYRFSDAMWSSLTGESAADVHTYILSGDHSNLDDKYKQLFDFDKSGSVGFFDVTAWLLSLMDENVPAASGMFAILNADDYDNTNYSRTTFIADILDGDYDDQLETGDPIGFDDSDSFSLTKLISSSYSFSSNISLQNLRAASSAASISDETSLESALPVGNSYSVSDASINHVTKIATSPPLPATKVSLSSTDWRDYAAIWRQWVRENTGSLDQSIFYQRSPAELADSLAYNQMLNADAVTPPSAYSSLFDMSASDFSGRIFPYISTDKRDAAIYQLNYVDKLLDPNGPNSGSNLNYERTTFIADLFDGDYDGDVRLPEIYRNLININNNYNSDGTPLFDSTDVVGISTAANNNLSQANYDLFLASANGTDTTDYTHTHVIPDILTGAYDIPESQAFMSDEIQIDLQTITASSTPNQSAFNASTFN